MLHIHRYLFLMICIGMLFLGWNIGHFGNSAQAAQDPTAVASPTSNAAVVTATVSDTSVPFASSETDALVPRGFMGTAQFGRLGIGCRVEILNTTDRAAHVKFMSCPKLDDMTPTRAGLAGWVARSALTVR